MLTLKKELNSKVATQCPYCEGFREEDFLEVDTAKAFIELIYKIDKESLLKHPDEMNASEIVAHGWLYFHVLSEGCLLYEEQSHFERTHNVN